LLLQVMLLLQLLLMTNIHTPAGHRPDNLIFCTTEAVTLLRLHPGGDQSAASRKLKSCFDETCSMVPEDHR
jgi:hypothetical protein